MPRQKMQVILPDKLTSQPVDITDGDNMDSKIESHRDKRFQALKKTEESRKKIEFKEDRRYLSSKTQGHFTIKVFNSITDVALAT